MRIKKIVLRNFKSFGKKVEIPFEKGFNVISGPNGSGKSNIIDAIVFCLALHSSSKVLRAEKLVDLIHTTDGKRFGEAEVAIIFDNGIEIKRKVRLTDKGYYSYYYLNGRSVSLSDISKVLEKSGIYSEAYNIIMQGDVTRIVEMTPFQRRKIIDDIAGISEFDEKKEKAFEELKVVKENVERISAILSEVEKRLKELERDREEALRFKELKERKDKLELELKAIERKDILNRIKRISGEIEKINKERDKAFIKISELRDKKREIERRIDDISKEIMEKADERYKAIQKSLSEYQIEIERIKKEIELYSKDIDNLNSERVKILLEISKLKDEIDKKRKELEKLLIQRVSVEESLNALDAKLSEISREIDSLGSEEAKLRDKVMRIREEIEELKNRKSEILRERDRIYEGVRRLSIEIEELETKLTIVRNEADEIGRVIEEKEKEIERLNDRLSGKIRMKNDIDRKIFDVRNRLAEIDKKMRCVEIELTKVKAEISAHEFSRAVELILEAKEKKALPGVYGIVAQLADVDEKYALALEIAAGNSLSFIVVEDEDCAIRAINYLKQIKGGRATFLPLNKIRRNFNSIFLDHSVLNKRGVIDYAVNLVRCEDKFKPVFNFIFRDTIVVDNIENAKRIIDGRRIVTLDGEIIEKSGAITGGSVDKRRRILLSRELKEKESRLSKELSELSDEKEALSNELRRLEELWRRLQSDIADVEKEINKLSNEIEVLKAKSEAISEEEIISSMEKKDNERRELSRKLGEIERKIKEIDKAVAEKEKEVDKLNKKLKSSMLAKLSNELEKLKSRQILTKEALIKIESEIDKVELEIDQNRENLEEKNNRLKEIETRISELESEIERGKSRIIELSAKIDELRKEEESISEEIKALRTERDKLFENLRDVENSEKRLEYEILSYEEKIKTKTEVLRELEENLKEMPEIEPSMKKSDVIKELERVNAELSRFGEVNMKAIQEYEIVKNRYADLKGRKDELEEERREIIKRIEKFERMKREKFFEVFNSINNNFKDVIASLTEGYGELYLDNYDDPFNSGLYMKVKPQNKPVQKLEQMSGGEKSLVALAFIFAIQRYKPAPFYAFDEIDMFLDGINVVKVAKLIKEMSSKAQFIVVSLRKPMLEKADVIIGVTMGRDNSSKVTGIKVSMTR